MSAYDPRDQRIRETVAWKLARFFWLLRLDTIDNHFEDVAWCGKQWVGRKYPPVPDPFSASRPSVGEAMIPDQEKVLSEE